MTARDERVLCVMRVCCMLLQLARWGDRAALVANFSSPLCSFAPCASRGSLSLSPNFRSRRPLSPLSLPCLCCPCTSGWLSHASFEAVDSPRFEAVPLHVSKRNIVRKNGPLWSINVMSMTHSAHRSIEQRSHLVRGIHPAVGHS
jgi:hypothetical protein